MGIPPTLQKNTESWLMFVRVRGRASDNLRVILEVENYKIEEMKYKKVMLWMVSFTICLMSYESIRASVFALPIIKRWRSILPLWRGGVCWLWLSRRNIQVWIILHASIPIHALPACLVYTTRVILNYKLQDFYPELIPKSIIQIFGFW